MKTLTFLSQLSDNGLADGLLIEAVKGHSKQNSPNFLPLRDTSGDLPHHF
tara:strand:- start:902 stop:1051 length:150 start_codon:yes stop_codon:yes gene_type:complete